MFNIPLLATFFTSRELHQKWRDGTLTPECAVAYPFVFPDPRLGILATSSSFTEGSIVGGVTWGILRKLSSSHVGDQIPEIPLAGNLEGAL